MCASNSIAVPRSTVQAHCACWHRIWETRRQRETRHPRPLLICADSEHLDLPGSGRESSGPQRGAALWSSGDGFRAALSEERVFRSLLAWSGLDGNGELDHVAFWCCSKLSREVGGSLEAREDHRTIPLNDYESGSNSRAWRHQRALGSSLRSSPSGRRNSRSSSLRVAAEGREFPTGARRKA